MIHFQNLGQICKNKLTTSEREILVFSPYINANAFEKIFSNINDDVHVSIVTTWDINDIKYGASDLLAYEKARRLGFQFLISPNIHLKTYLVDHKELLTGSANLTNRGMGFVRNSNIETLVEIDSCPNDYLCHLLSILHDSILVDDDLFEFFKSKIGKIEKLPVDEESQSAIDGELLSRKRFLVSELPMSESVKFIFDTLRDTKKIDDLYTYCVFHDLVKYNMSNIKAHNLNEFKKQFAYEFFKHPFISKLVNYLDEPKSFGNVKAWIQNNCADIPVPNRRELTLNVRVLFDWFVELDNKRFEVKKPNYAEVIFKKG